MAASERRDVSMRSPDLDDMPGHLVRVAQQVHTAAWARGVSSEVTSVQFAVLLGLAQRPTLDQKEIGRIVSLDKSTTTSVLRLLETRGSILRRQHPDDGRRNSVVLTASGRAEVERLDRAVAAVQESLVSVLDDSARLLLLDGLRTLARIDASDPEPPLYIQNDGARRMPLLSAPGHLLRRSQQVHSELWKDIVGRGLTSPQFAVLSSVAENPGSDQQSIGSLASLDKSSMAELVGRLSARGSIALQRDRLDGRRKLLFPTAQTASVLVELTPRVIEVQDRLLEPVAAKSRGPLLRALSVVAAGPADN